MNALGFSVEQAENAPNQVNDLQRRCRTSAGGVWPDREIDYSKRIDPTEATIRTMRAQAFALAARDCHPDDARQLATALLIDLSAGMPSEHVFGSVREDARWWAGRATPMELCEVLGAALERLRDRALHRDMRKTLFLRLWRSFGAADRERFLTFAKGEA